MDSIATFTALETCCLDIAAIGPGPAAAVRATAVYRVALRAPGPPMHELRTPLVQPEASAVLTGIVARQTACFARTRNFAAPTHQSALEKTAPSPRYPQLILSIV